MRRGFSLARLADRGISQRTVRQRVRFILDSSVSAEEERTRFRDRADGRYPILARQFAERRDNLKVTIATLEARLSSDSMNVPAKIVSTP
jgi:hypothetical protein